MRLLIIFILMLSNSFASDTSDIKNLVINKELKNYSDITFLDIKNKELYLNDYKGNLVLLNFWATWCAPCREEMPSLDKLQNLKILNNLKVIPINVGQEKIDKSTKKYKNSIRDQVLQIYEANKDLRFSKDKTGAPTIMEIMQENVPSYQKGQKISVPTRHYEVVSKVIPYHLRKSLNKS